MARDGIGHPMRTKAPEDPGGWLTFRPLEAL
jgi:hypothetical protein